MTEQFTLGQYSVFVSLGLAIGVYGTLRHMSLGDIWAFSFAFLVYLIVSRITYVRWSK